MKHLIKVKIYTVHFSISNRIFVCFISSFIFIEILDGREINELTRQFLINWKASKEAKKKKNNKHMMTGPLIPYPLTSESLNSVLF